ncbi:metal-dependent hydrolase family protein [Natranaerobius thermophilus]|uniref:Amidohydrolase n=1 Tax=Natranaerobius thermophilus (strain ATCC BAA-1301 / DSM 18059 / JW/NM-WN-LF) TaxID=457570 RepID=B2A2P7_NATTJ|nr:amidohydrolase family protein [Natranaerobius thermophilus]ACB86265.1 amidohydrolase [Natranaerobius thermophilus JW/NM-WN-LF]
MNRTGQEPLLIRSVNVITGQNDEILEQYDVYIEQGSIAKIGKNLANEAKLADWNVIEGTGKYLIPGLIDTHVHLVWDGSGDPQAEIEGKSESYMALMAARQAQDCLKNGITTVRDVGSPGETVLNLRDAIKGGKLEGANIVSSGSALVMIGGHGWFLGTEISGPEEARRAAREVLKQGADLIKVMATGGIYTQGEEPGAPQLSEEEMRAAVVEAHNQGKKVASHAQGSTGIHNSIQAGVDSVEHCIFADEKALTNMQDRNIFMVPTLAVMKRMADIGVGGGLPEYAAEKAKRVVKIHKETFKTAVDLNVKIAVGTDLFAPYLPVEQYFTELKIMNDYGMSLSDVLKSATSVAAELLQLEDRGVIAENKVADLVLLNENPLNDVKAYQNQEMIIKEGRIIK